MSERVPSRCWRGRQHQQQYFLKFLPAVQKNGMLQKSAAEINIVSCRQDNEILCRVISHLQKIFVTSTQANQLQTKFYIPHPLLQEFVQCIMLVHAEVDPDSPAVICPYPPTPQNSLFFYINDRIKVQQEENDAFILQPRSVIVGPQLNRVTIDINKNHKAVRVGFHPGGLHRLLGLSMAEILSLHFIETDSINSSRNLICSNLFGHTQHFSQERKYAKQCQ